MMLKRKVDLIRFNSKYYPDPIAKLIDNVFDKFEELGILYSTSIGKSMESLYEGLAAGDYSRANVILNNMYESYYRIRGQQHIGTVTGEYIVGDYMISLQQDIGKGAPVTMQIYEVPKDQHRTKNVLHTST